MSYGYGGYKKKTEADKFWDEKVVPKERECQAELANCKKQGRRTLAYDNLCRDLNKLKAEYEAMKGGKSYDPHNLADVESAAERTARQYLGENRG